LAPIRGTVTCERRVVSEVVDQTRTVVFHRFEGADETKLREQARTTKMAPRLMKVVSAKDPRGTGGFRAWSVGRESSYYTERLVRFLRESTA